MEQLKDGDTSTKLKEISIAFASYHEVVLPHLKEEEELGLILARAYFTPKEMGAMVSKILEKAPDVELGSFIHDIGPDNFRKVFMVQEGIPFFVWYIAFKKKHAAFLRDFVAHSEAIKNGEPPKKAGGLFAGLFAKSTKV